MTLRWIGVFALLGVGVAPTAHGAEVVDRFTLSSGARLPYHHTHSLNGATEPTAAVVVVHGTGRNARGYFDATVKAAEHAGARGTLVIAPHFQTSDDKPAKGDVYWTNGDATSWKDGGDSVSKGDISSFAAMDEVLARLSDKSRFPKLNRITVIGHSAGGQFVQRYAAGSPAATPSTRFVTANASSYLYFTAKRPAPIGKCPEYDNYKYGVQRLNRYMAGKPLQQQYTDRAVTYLLGGDDIHQNHSIDDSCSAKAQGKHRLERGRNHFAAFPSAAHKLVVAPGIGHDHAKLFDSDQGRKVIFGD
ncbi:hypothetical protein NLX83_27565 [Allokutzneria sp. A3M-2-11 16]|uniref:hypothetical protein n=1 Tax=Allokutzneria sp. A3M-2-11 16 TaxID=2962043 RepID=UPI0020B8B752|nr:hypothetical protein [Allokutzneria sp. A3M-2-11 16]MCP3803039.1 hypothetical protein [Allokutzneria sp. A3M-2-11 16]